MRCAAGGLIAGLAALAITVPAVPAGAAAPTDRTCADEFIFGGTFKDVVVPAGRWCLIGEATITGSFRADRASSIGIFSQTSIAGDVTISGTQSNPDATGATFGGSANGICTTKINGDLTIAGDAADAPWNVGSTNYPPYANFSNCVFPNTIRGTVRFTDNAATANAIGGNTIGGDLVCTGNAGFSPGFLAPGTPNQVSGTSRGQCATLGTNPERPTASTSPPTACRSRRRFTIRLDQRLVTGRVTVSSRPSSRRPPVRRRRGRLTAVIDLRGLPPQSVVVMITGRTRAGTRLQSTRTYRACPTKQTARLTPSGSGPSSGRASTPNA